MKRVALAMAAVLAIGAAAAQAGGTEEALKLSPDLERGKEIYEACTACHMPEGWGRADGTFPEIAGQHRSVLIKQLIDIREGNRSTPAIHPFALPSEIGNEQALADVTGYISRLPMNPENGHGPGTGLAHGKELYEQNCAACHGPDGAGDAANSYPRIQGQHYEYLLRQFRRIKEGKRRNAHPDMMAQIQAFSSADASDVIDYVSRLEPPKAIVAPKGWQNPDFK